MYKNLRKIKKKYAFWEKFVKILKITREIFKDKAINS